MRSTPDAFVYSGTTTARMQVIYRRETSNYLNVPRSPPLRSPVSGLHGQHSTVYYYSCTRWKVRTTYGWAMSPPRDAGSRQVVKNGLECGAADYPQCPWSRHLRGPRAAACARACVSEQCGAPVHRREAGDSRAERRTLHRGIRRHMPGADVLPGPVIEAAINAAIEERLDSGSSVAARSSRAGALLPPSPSPRAGTGGVGAAHWRRCSGAFFRVIYIAWPRAASGGIVDANVGFLSKYLQIT